MNLKQMINKAFSLHQKGEFEEAERIYSELLQVYPENINILNLYGMLCMQLKKFNKAISLLSRAVILGDSAYIMTNLGKAYLYSGETEQAIKIFEDAKDLEKPNDDLLYSLAIAYRRVNNNKKAINAYKAAIEYNPNNYNVSYNLALLLSELGDYPNAINYASKCLLIEPNSEEIFVMLAGFYEKLNDIDMAIINWEKAADINPKQYLYFYNLGVLFSKLKCIQNAISSYRKCLLVKPDFVEALINIATLYKETDLNVALEFVIKAREIAPNEKNVILNLAQIYIDLSKNKECIELLNDFVKNNLCSDAYSLLGKNYMDLGEYNLALDNYNKALEIEPENCNYLHCKAIALKYLGKTKDAKKILEKLLKKNPNDVQIAISLGMLYLFEKDFNNGMKFYQKRSLETKIPPQYKSKILFEKLTQNDKKILVYSDCGLGDTLMFCRYLPFLKDKAKSIVLQTDMELVSILQKSYSDLTVIPKSVIPPDFDILIPIMNLPYVLDMDFNSIPFANGYLVSDVTKSISELNTKKTKIGLCFKGNDKILKNRFIDEKIINNILKINNATFYTFKNSLENTVSLNAYINDYSDTAEILKKLDLLITIDSSIAHMAGALGVKTYLLLPYISEWRWFNDKKTTPWYNSIEIFKQSQNGNWLPVIDEIIEKINNDIK